MAGALLKNNFNKGEIDPEADERLDLKPWRNAVQLGRNVEFRAKGGFSQRPALASMARLRRRLEAVEITADMVTAPNGGDVSLLLGDGELSVANTGDDCVVLLIDFGVVQPLTVFDVLGFKSSADVSGARLLAESSVDGSGWTDFGAAHALTGGYRSRRFSVRDAISVRYVRLVVRGLAAASSFYLKSVQFFLESDEVSDVASFSRGEYVLALTDRTGAMFKNGQLLAELPLDIGHELIRSTTSAGSLSTILLFNQSFHPIRIKKNIDDGAVSWNVDLPNFENIPALSAGSALDGDSGPMMSAENGWPSCGAFHQARLALGGFPKAPTTYIMSRLGHPFDFKQKFSSEVTPDAGIEDTIDSDEEEHIRRLYVGRHFQIFTNMGEWYISTRSIDASKPRNVISATRVGVAAAPRLVSVDGGTLFGQEGGGAIEDFFYSDVEQSYNTSPASLWGAHLVGDVVSLARRRAEGRRDANLVFSVNDDGGAVLITLMRKQEVFAMSRIKTKGKARSVAVDNNRNVFFVVERTRDGQTDNWLEKWDDARLLDASRLFSFDDPETLVSGLEHLEGETVWAMVDGTPEGPYIVNGGHIQLSRPGKNVEVGYLFDMRVRDMPLRQRLPDGSESKKPIRVHTLYLSLENTGELDVRVGDESRLGEWREVIMNRHDHMRLDTPLMDRLFTGEAKVENLRGFYDAPWVELVRPVPCPVLVKSMAKGVV